MTRILFIFFTIFSGSLMNVSAAEWFPIGATWNWTINYPYDNGAYLTIEITKDTVVNGYEFKKGEVTQFDENSPYGRKRPEATILFENDNGKINYLFQGNTYRLYDFNLDVGDTMYTDMTLLSYRLSLSTEKDTFMTAKSIVDSIDTLYLDGFPLKRMHLTSLISEDEIYGEAMVSLMSFQLIEKMGFDVAIGFFGSVGNYPIVLGGFTGELRCYTDDDISYQKNEKISCDSLTSLYPKNTWFPFGATWYYETVYWVETHYGYLKIEVVGDTLIQNKKVSILDRTFVSALVSNNTTIRKADPLYLYYEKGKVIQWVNGEFITIYEFFLPKGAAHIINGFTHEENPIYATVDSVWSKTINGRKLNAFSINDTIAVDNDFECIMVEIPAVFEKIGSIFSFFPVITPCEAIDYPHDVQILRCYSDPEIGFIGVRDLQSLGPKYTTCDTLVPYYRVRVKENLSGFTKIYPNPTEDILNIEFEKTMNFIKVEIFALDGRKVKTFHQINSGKFNVSGLETGVYIIMATSEKGQQYYNRFIKK